MADRKTQGDGDMETRVFLVDDHAMFRSGLRLLLDREPDLSVVGEAGDGRTALEMVGELAPDVVVMDINMPDLDGIETTRRLLAEAPGTKIIALSIHSEKGFVQRMLLAGAAGYILKESVPEEVVEGVRAVHAGDVYLSAAITDIVVSGYKDFLSDFGAEEEGSSETKSLPLLTTKLHRPPISQRVVLRRRLIDLLEEGRWRPLTLVSAPAGYGKSTLVSQWLETIESDCPSAWISLDKSDNDLRAFTTYLLAAVQRLFPESLEDTSRLLKAPVFPPMQVLARTLVNELIRVPESFILVLDDYHHIVEPSIHELLSEILRQTLKNTHFVLVTRTDPPLDLLSLLAYRRMGEVRARELSFTTQETAAFLQMVVGAAVDDDIVKALNDRTDGWVTGLRLITLSVNDSAALTNISTILPGEQETLDYLAAEALSRQPRDIQSWLLETAILDRFCAPLCQAVCSPSEARESSILDGDGFIRWLTGSNLFVIPLDQHGGWFRYHHLFQELLQNQLQNALDAGDIANLHLRASRWLVENGLLEDAIDHALSGGDEIGAAQIVETYRYPLLNEDRWYILQKQVAKLPQEIVQQRPELLLAQAWFFFHRLDYQSLTKILEDVDRILVGDEKSAPLRGELDFFRGHIAYFQAQGLQAEKILVSALEIIPEVFYRGLGEAELHYALALHMNGRTEMALDRLNSLIHSQRLRKGIVRSRLWSGVYWVHLFDGNLPEIIHPARQIKEIASTTNNEYAETWAGYMEACAHFHWNDMEGALQGFNQLVAQRYVLHVRAAIDGLCALSLAYQQLQRLDDADETVKLLFEFAGKMDDPVYGPVALSLQARLSLLRGDSALAQRWLRTFDLAADAGIMFSWIEVPRITACRVLVAEGSQDSLQKAIEKLRGYQKENEGVHNTYQVIVILSLLALAYHKQGEHDQALAVLAESLELGRPGGWIWPFIEGGSPMTGLLKRLKQQDIPTDLDIYIDRILAAYPSRTPTRQPGLIEPLTERELQVLRLLTSALSVTEIAAELVVSVHTVRMHTKNIYSKLDVHSRIEAVECARELGLI